VRDQATRPALPGALECELGQAGACAALPLSRGDGDAPDERVPPVRAQFDAGAADDVAGVVALDPEPHPGPVEAGKREVGGGQEPPHVRDLRRIDPAKHHP